MIRLDDHPDPLQSTAAYDIYNMNENLIMYSSHATAPMLTAPDSICYYSERIGQGLTNAFDDLAPYYDRRRSHSTGVPVSVIGVRAIDSFREAKGVLASFGTLSAGTGTEGSIFL